MAGKRPPPHQLGEHLYGRTLLTQARKWIQEKRVTTRGAICPCCDGFSKEYARRTITWKMAEVLVEMHKKTERGDADAPGGWIDTPALAGVMRSRRSRSTGGDESKLRFWGLIEPMPNVKRNDGSNRVGWWRVTPKGRQFVLDEIRVPMYVRIYNNESLGLWGDDMGIRNVEGFDYDKAMEEES